MSLELVFFTGAIVLKLVPSQAYLNDNYNTVEPLYRTCPY